MKGEGKGWAKGRTAANDPRVARRAASHRGLIYRRHASAGQGAVRTLPLEWSDTMAYVVGLIATDGCLVSTGRHISFDSNDEQLVRTYLACLGRPLHYRQIRTPLGHWTYKARFSDVRFYRWLLARGLTPRKSLTIGAIDVPDAHLASLLRGLLDGDGTIQNFIHRPTVSTYPDYAYERLWLFFTSASRAHIDWLKSRTDSLFGTSGYVERRPPRPPSKEYFRVKYGKRDATVLLRAMYPDAAVPKLDRKWAIWLDYTRRHGSSGD